MLLVVHQIRQKSVECIRSFLRHDPTSLAFILIQYSKRLSLLDAQLRIQGKIIRIKPSVKSGDVRRKLKSCPIFQNFRTHGKLLVPKKNRVKLKNDVTISAHFLNQKSTCDARQEEGSWRVQ